MRFATVDHSSDPLVWTYSDYADITGYGIATIFQYSDSLFYIILTNGSDRSKYEYNADENILTYIHNFTIPMSSYATNKNLLFKGDIISDEIVIETYDLYAEEYNVYYPPSQTGHTDSYWTINSRETGDRLLTTITPQGIAWGIQHWYKDGGLYSGRLNCGLLDVNNNFTYFSVVLPGDLTDTNFDGSFSVSRFGSALYNDNACYMWNKTVLGTGTNYFCVIDVIHGTILDGSTGTLSAFFNNLSYSVNAIWSWSGIYAALTDSLGNGQMYDYTPTYLDGVLTGLESRTDLLTNHLYAVSVPSPSGYIRLAKRPLGGSTLLIVFSAYINTSFSDSFRKSHLGENVVSVEIHDGGDNGNYLYFYEFGTFTPPSGGGYKTLIKDQDNFVVIDATSVPQRLEASKPYPLATFAYYYGAPVTGMVTPAINSEWVRMIYLPTTSGLGTGVTLSGYSGITDLRLFSLYAGDSIPISGVDYVTSGSVSAGVYVSGIGVPIHDVDPIAGDWTILTPISGAVGRFETTNYGIPYFFIASMSGTTIPSGYSTFSGFTSSGNIPNFLQRNPTSSGFVDYSTGLPGTEITVIRVDDRV